MHPPATETRRPRCTRCDRPQRTCLCAWVRPVANGLPLLVLQHPAEVAQAKGTLRLLQLSLDRITVLVGESFDDALLADALHDGAALLYPGDDLASAPATSPRQLVLLDGTWRQTRQMLRLNPRLQALPRIGLPVGALQPSRYAIRRAHAPQQRSTLEAACAALSSWDSGADTQPLLDAFEGWMRAQAAFRSALGQPESGVE